MKQHIDNLSTVSNQINIAENYGNLSLSPKTRFSKRFEKLKNEIESNLQYKKILSDFEYYNTKLDGKDMPSKLEDGGFSENYISKATLKKQKYAKKAEKYKFYESAQWIDCQLFAKIKLEFDTHVEPLINKGAERAIITQAVTEKVVKPVLDLINIEGENDDILNYDSEDILGMIYYLTGKCHINWKNYDYI
nr:ABC-three component system protein [uncultured Bacteroides sp.]